ncbi:tetratricopeptide (TPR) repeat protein [Streptomyces sp. SAI-170]|uniref:helix-turn-helix domain-containing protein n=1 Tax=Streptomyces sp. SAI-170 TaxID=3377729 RepID=UPI003C7E2A25
MDQNNPIAVGKRLRDLRKRKGLHQRDLASQDVSGSYISLIESGKRYPSDAVFASLAERLGCTVEYLRDGRHESRAKELQLKVAFGDMALRNGDNGEALQAYSEALGQADQLDATTIRRARRGQAHALEKLGQLEASIPLLHELYEDPETVPGSQEWTQLAVALCRCYRAVGDLTLAVELGEAALSRLSTLGLDVTDDHVQLGATLIACYRDRGDLTRAHLLANRLLGTAEEAQSRSGRGAVYWNAGLVAESRGQTDEALALVERALVLMAEDDNVRHLAMLRHAAGWLMLASETPDLPRAKELLTQAQEALVQVGSAGEQAECEVNLAYVEMRMGELDSGIARAKRALGLIGAEARAEAVHARLAVAEGMLLKGDGDQAMAALRAAERQLGHLPSSRTTAKFWSHIGDLWTQCESHTEATNAFRQALAEVGLRPWHVTTGVLSGNPA